MSIKKELGKIGRLPWSLFRRVAPPIIQPITVNWGKRALGTKFLLVACMPKSGSTFLTSTIGGLPGFRSGSAVPAFGRREQEIDEWSLIRSSELSKNTVFQHHICYSEETERLLVRYPFHLVVLCRDLRDVVASISDHWDKESIVGPFAFLNEHYLNDIDKRKKRLDFIVDMILPWYIKFYVSWKQYAEKGRPVQFVTYEEMMKDNMGTIKSILSHASLNVPEIAIAEALHVDRFTRFNKGISGRGDTLFRENPLANETLQRYVSYYPDIDFRPVLRIHS